MSLHPEEASVIKGLLARGDKQHEVAALFGVNSGRVAEIASGKSHAEVPAMPVEGRFVPLRFSLIDAMVRKAAVVGHPIAEPFSVRPEDAAAILGDEHGRNAGNRPRKQIKISEYRTDMETGRWRLNGTSLKIDELGYLVDGQNRLQACILAGVSFDTMVVFGVPREYFMTMDKGKPRSGSDLLHIEGCLNASKVAGALRWITILNGPTPTDRSQSYTPQEILGFWRDPGLDRELLYKSISAATGIYETYGHSVTQLGGVYYVLASVDQERTAELFTAWKQKQRRVAALQEFLAKAADRSTNKRLPELVLIGAVIKAWNRIDRRAKLRIFDVTMTIEEGFESWR